MTARMAGVSPSADMGGSGRGRRTPRPASRLRARACCSTGEPDGSGLSDRACNTAATGRDGRQPPTDALIKLPTARCPRDTAATPAPPNFLAGDPPPQAPPGGSRNAGGPGRVSQGAIRPPGGKRAKGGLTLASLPLHLSGGSAPAKGGKKESASRSIENIVRRHPAAGLSGGKPPPSTPLTLKAVGRLCQIRFAVEIADFQRRPAGRGGTT